MQVTTPTQVVAMNQHTVVRSPKSADQHQEDEGNDCGLQKNLGGA